MAGGRRTTGGDGESYRDVGPWALIKTGIISDYAVPYTRIISKKPWCKGVWYVDAFAGDPVNALRTQGRATSVLVEGSASKALRVDPPFSQYHFIDLEPETIRRLALRAEGRPNVHIHKGDANQVISQSLVPQLQYNSFRRALVILDPYGMHLDWATIKQLGECKTAEVFINFPTMDINRNALRRDQSTVSDRARVAMTRLWGSEGWQSTAFAMRQINLFGPSEPIKTINNEGLVEAFRQRLETEAGFKFAAEPFPIRNSKNAVMYYLIFASQDETGYNIMSDVMRRWRRKSQG